MSQGAPSLPAMSTGSAAAASIGNVVATPSGEIQTASKPPSGTQPRRQGAQSSAGPGARGSQPPTPRMPPPGMATKARSKRASNDSGGGVVKREASALNHSTVSTGAEPSASSP